MKYDKISIKDAIEEYRWTSMRKSILDSVDVDLWSYVILKYNGASINLGVRRLNILAALNEETRNE